MKRLIVKLRKSAKHFTPYSVFRTKKGLLLIILFAIAGSAALLLTRAAAVYPVVDASLATVNNGAIKGTDTTAPFIQFKAPESCPVGQTGTPPNCTTEQCPAGTTGTPPNCVTPVQGAVPPLSQVGPRGQQTPYPGGALIPGTQYKEVSLSPGTYRNYSFDLVHLASSGTYTFIDSTIGQLDGGIGIGRKAILDHVRVNGGIWFDTGSHSGWEIRWSVIDGGGTQALRPNGPGSILVEDSWLLVHDTPWDPNIHTEAVQNLNDAGGIYNRVAFSVQPQWPSWGTPITAVLNLGNGPMTFTDCIMGYYNGSAWSAGGGFYAIYPGTQSIWIRPIIYHGGSGYWFTDQPIPTGARLVSPTLL